MFKLLSIRPLEGCADYIQKCLKTGMMYYFCNDYIIEPGSHIRRRSKNIKPLKEDFFTVVPESDYSEDNSSERKSPTVSVSAIVGMNGDGKSTLVELMMRLINNCAISYELCALSDNSKGKKGNKTEPHYNLRRVENAKAELYYMIDNVVYRMAEEKDQKDTRIWKVLELNPFNEKGEELMRWEIDSVEIQKVEDDPKGFFFTIVSNYSHYAYNIYDYKKEWEIRGGEKDDDEKCWLHYIFHKNDGYLTPITLHPYRYKGNIDINVEKDLSKQRLLSLFLNAEKPTDQKPTFRRVNGKDANVLRLTEKTTSKLQHETILKFFKETNQQSRFDDLLQKMKEIEDAFSHLYFPDKNYWMEKYYDLVENVIPSLFINPINTILEQDVGFRAFVREVGNWLKKTSSGNSMFTGDIGIVIERFFHLYENVRHASTLHEINMEYKKEVDDITDNAVNLNLKDTKELIKRGKANFNKGDYDSALWDFSRAIKINQNDIEAYFNRGNTNFILGNYGSAIWDYGKAICLNPKNAVFYFNLGNSYYQKCDYNAAIYEYDMAININPKFEWAFYNRGNANCKIGDYDAAISDYSKAIYLNSDDIGAIINRGNTSFIIHDYDAAIWDYGKAVCLNPKNADYYYNLGNSYYQKGDYDSAIYEYDIAIKIKPRFEEAYSNRGNAYFNMGYYNKAIIDYSKEIELYPMNAEAYYNRGNAYYNKGIYDKAIKDYDKAINYPANKSVYVDNNGLNWKDVNAYNNRGNAYYKIAKYDLAIADYGKVISLNPKNVEAYIKRGNTNCKVGDFSAAIWDYGKAVNLDPKNAEAYFCLGTAYYQKGDYDAAIYEYNIAITLDSNYVGRGMDMGSIKNYWNSTECKQANNMTAIKLLRMFDNQRGESLRQTIMQVRANSDKKVLYSMESINEFGFVDFVNTAQLGRLDTIYRVMKTYNIDWKIIAKDYTDLSLKEKCQHYIVYKVCSILSNYPQYRDMCFIDGIEPIREFGPAMEEGILAINKDDSHITRKLRQVNIYLDEIQDDKGLYDRLGKWDDENRLLVDIDLLKKHYRDGFVSLDNLPPPIYNWDIVFQKKDDFSCKIELDTFSSGEKQKLNSIGAIIYHLQNLNHTASKVKYNNVNLILEEIELYYHPEYQRQFFNELLARIKEAKLENIQNINIVFVTHSPFILSDIPKCNVLFLKEGMPKDIMQENTFGANIHTLLKNGFFMPNLPIGEFAYGKINKLFGKLNSGELDSDNDLDEIYQEILLVGEPFLRNQLLMLYNSYKGSRVMPVNTNKKGIKS